LALIAVLALTVRVLLLLAGLLTAALLTLLAGLLTRVLILLAGILVLVGHRRSPLLKRNGETTENPKVGFKGTCGSAAIIAWRRFVATVALEPGRKLPLYKPFKPHPALLPVRVPAVRKWDDATFRLPGPSPRPNNGSAWTISPSN
jgi:hypothetical protein